MLSHTGYVFGDQKVQVPAHLNFGKYMLDRLKTKTHEIALQNIDTKGKLSYKDVTQYAVNLAASLIELGIGRGDVVAVGTEKRIEFIPIVLAVVFTGATYTAHDLNSGRAALKHKINITQPKYFICSQKFLDQYKTMLQSYDCLEMLMTIDDQFEKVKSLKDLTKNNVDVELFEPSPVSGQADVAVIFYSSGTTGMSKGVQLTHLNCILNSLPDDFSDISLKAIFMSGYWCHSYDMFMAYKFLACGRKVLFTEEINSESILRSIDEYQTNILFLVPSLVSFLSKEGDVSKYNLDSLRMIYAGSCSLHTKTIDKVKQMFPNLKNVLQGYGMTEAGELTSESWGHKGPKPESVGKASPGVTLKVSDVETRKTLGPNERGEICLKGPVLMKGYVGMDLSSYMDEEGFFRTGDLGYYDEDEYFYIVGRLKEIIIYDGDNVPPLELETFLQLHPGVREAGVVGKPVPDYGEEPTAFVVKQPGSTVTEQELVDYIAGEVAPYMQLRGGVKFIEEMPRNPRGKILRHKLKDLLHEN